MSFVRASPCIALFTALMGCATPRHAVTVSTANRLLETPFGITRAPLASEILANGMRVARLEGRDGIFETAILFSGGPLLDPADRPGLTEWTVRSAVIATDGDRSDELGPEARALALGVTLVPVLHGTLFGWIARGPVSSQEAASELLADLVQRPSFPATAMQIMGSRERRRIEADGDEPLNTMVAVATGFALGLKRPLRLQPSASLFDVVLREDVVRHWRRWFRPSRAVLVTSATEPLPRVWRSWREAGVALSVQASCTPHGQSAHLISAQDGDTDDVLTVFATAIPGVGSSARSGLGAWFGVLAERPGGPIASAVGFEQARRASPSVIDLAAEPGLSVSVALAGTRGSGTEALGDLRRVAQLLHPLSRPVDTAATEGSLRSSAAEFVMRHEQPLARSVLLAEEAMYGRARIPTASETRAFAEDLLEPWRYTFVGLGGANLQVELEQIAPVYRWDASGQPLGGSAPPRCEQSPDG